MSEESTTSARRGFPDPAEVFDRRSPRSSRADSPWFWLILFGLTALAALMVVGPKFARRQSKLQQNYEGRWDAWQRRIEREAGDTQAPTPADTP